ncbi:hypothetical protein Ga0466249_001850 [Sporomusaceae bacterium BoRhaA]|uniref:TIGR02678 family protein n=1 Tax=Pelorhabdus rhamnosifermentans TaxID=2772457 RepID=UPI001C063924|nr:TIGR02678 family protein [Pelorhabdus rhamnosifermentans]MBU2700745.1 hypothetical protein [Pelorhabdus rhamnosifermentans]
MQQEKILTFDDTDRETAAQLLEKYWVIRDREPELYQQIREREQMLRNYFFDKCGFYLLVHKDFAKLEKIPDQAESWMGFSELEKPRDYALLCCLLAYLENKSIDEQFLLSDLCEALPVLYPVNDETDDSEINWESYEWRRTLVRVLSFACDQAILSRVDGEIGGFSGSQEQEVLFEVPSLSRYFLRSYPKDLFQYADKNELIQAERADDENQKTGRTRRNRIYRQLLLTPSYDKGEAQEDDFLYLRNRRNRLLDDIAAHTLFAFELYEQVAMLTLPEKRVFATVFPDQRAVSDVLLHFARYVRATVEDGVNVPTTEGRVILTPAEFERLLLLCKEQTDHGWSKEVRTWSLAKLSQQVLQELVEWKFAHIEEETGMVCLRPSLARAVGQYPKDYRQGVDGHGNE